MLLTARWRLCWSPRACSLSCDLRWLAGLTLSALLPLCHSAVLTLQLLSLLRVLLSRGSSWQDGGGAGGDTAVVSLTWCCCVTWELLCLGGLVGPASGLCPWYHHSYLSRTSSSFNHLFTGVGQGICVVTLFGVKLLVLSKSLTELRG